MRFENNILIFSPSDLMTFQESPFASYMERWRLIDPTVESYMDSEDPILGALAQKGFDHENKFSEKLKKEGRSIIVIERDDYQKMRRNTHEAMKSGVDVIVQAYLSSSDFSGFSDYMIRRSGSSKLGDYHYEIWDAKLARKIKPHFAIQLCAYSEMIEDIQGYRPHSASIVLGSGSVEEINLHNYAAYYTNLKRQFLAFHEKWSLDKKPDPALSLSFGRWTNYAGEILSDKRHLSLVANITRTQIKRLEKNGIKSIDALADAKVASIPKMNKNIFNRLREQALLQVQSEAQDIPKYKLIADHDKLGLSLLPPHSNSDLFFDIEGFPLFDDGLEYLWGITYFDQSGKRGFKDYWAHDRDEEKLAFTSFIDWVFERWTNDKEMHIYHYGAYEINALRRLMGRFGVKEYEVDTLLRNEVFVDLYKIIRQGLLVGEPSYSIKNIEHLYREKRDTEIASGGESVVVYEEWRANPDGKTWKDSKTLNAIRMYNIDDCNSTQELTEWLRERQQDAGIKYSEDSYEEEVLVAEDVTEKSKLRDQILNSSHDQKTSEMELLYRNLAWFLEFHRRENKPTWWRMFDRQGLTEIDLYDDMDCLVGLSRTEKKPYLPTERSRNFVYEYEFDPNQPVKGFHKSYYVLGEDNIKVTAVSLNIDKGLIELQSGSEPEANISLIPDQYVRPDPIPEAIEDVIQKIMESNFSSSALVDFLLRKQPSFSSGPKDKLISKNLSEDDLISEITKTVFDLNNSYLCIQGPPGAGKTYIAKCVIGDLLKSGKRIGISSNSHKAITNLLGGVAGYVKDNGIEANLIKVGGDRDDIIFSKPNVFFRKDIKSCLSEINNTSLCVGGTAWLFCNTLFTSENETEPLDYLFIDEAGQVPVANLVGMSRATKNIILIGDQMQLGQPSQGSHPDNSGESILEYLLEDKSTIPNHLGIFLPITYRLHPEICSLLSDQVYDGRLYSAPITASHCIDIDEKKFPKKGGVVFVPVEHEGNSQGSEEEAEEIAKIANKLIGATYWKSDDDGAKLHIGWQDMLFVAPYNYQVNLLKAVLPSDALIGSVDKFQGQEAPIVFVSMCTSDPSESPRGLDFIFSKNRLNVAISRGQSLAIIVGSPKLGSTPVGNLRQMGLVNFYSAIMEYQ